MCISPRAVSATSACLGRICNYLHCKKGGLITARHNNLCDGVSELAGKAFTPAHVRDDPKIFLQVAPCGGKAKAKGKGKEAPPAEEGSEKGLY